MIAVQEKSSRTRIVEDDRVLTHNMKWKFRTPATIRTEEVISIGRTIRRRVAQQVVSRGKQFRPVINSDVGDQQTTIPSDKRLLLEPRLACCIESLVAQAQRISSHDPAAIWSPLMQRLPKCGQIAQVLFAIERPFVEIENRTNRAHRLSPSNPSQLSISGFHLAEVIHHCAVNFHPRVALGRKLLRGQDHLRGYTFAT